MPAAKKSTKPTTTKAVKKPRAKSTKKAAPTRKNTRSTKANQERSFHLSKDSQDFMEFKLTRQTIYWLILGAIVLAHGIWTINIHQRVQRIYDEIEQSNIYQQELDEREIQILRDKKAQEKQ